MAGIVLPRSAGGVGKRFAAFWRVSGRNLVVFADEYKKQNADDRCERDDEEPEDALVGLKASAVEQVGESGAVGQGVNDPGGDPERLCAGEFDVWLGAANSSGCAQKSNRYTGAT